MVEFNDITLTAGKQRKRGSLSWAASSPSSMDFRSKTAARPRQHPAVRPEESELVPLL